MLPAHRVAGLVAGFSGSGQMGAIPPGSAVITSALVRLNSIEKPWKSAKLAGKLTVAPLKIAL